MSTTSDELFKFSWTVEGASVWNHKTDIDSPCFEVDELGDASFYLKWTESGDEEGYSELFFCRTKHGGPPGEVKVKNVMKFCGESEPVTVDVMEKGACLGWDSCIENDSLFKTDDWLMLSGSLSMECTIYRADDGLEVCEEDQNSDSRRKPPLTKRCSAVTRLKSEVVSLEWNIGDFSKISSGEEVTTQILSYPEKSPRFLLTLHTTGNGEEEDVALKIAHLGRPQTTSPLFVACKASVGTRIVRVDQHVFDPLDDSYSATWNFPALSSRRELLAEEAGFVNGDTLSLLLELKIWDGTQTSEVKEASYRSTSRPAVPRPASARENLLSLFKEQSYCDVTFEIPPKEIRAHKLILRGNSGFFRAMFQDDELIQTKTVKVTDIAFETFEAFLAYLYAGRLEGPGLTPQLVGQLYFAADKYQVDSLKSDCTRFLRDHLRVENVCEVLALADRHKDEDLMATAAVYVARCKRKVLASEEWKAFFEADIKLAARVLQWLGKH